MLKTFSIGGVHPHENKLSAHQPIVQAEIPAKAVILLSQHIGAPAKPIVAKGDVVKVGTKDCRTRRLRISGYPFVCQRKGRKKSTLSSMPADTPKPAVFIDDRGG